MYDLFHLEEEQVGDHLHQDYSASLLDLLILHHDMMHNNLDKALQFQVELIVVLLQLLLQFYYLSYTDI